jgi:hypothetical protein
MVLEIQKREAVCEGKKGTSTDLDAPLNNPNREDSYVGGQKIHTHKQTRTGHLCRISDM